MSATSSIPHQAYLQAVLQELTERAPLFAGRPLVSIYLGGGTPSLWEPSCIQTLVQRIKHTFPAHREGLAEITLECDPLDVLQASPGWWLTLTQAGVNRLSMGIQSLQDTRLQELGRLHTADQVRAAMARVRECSGWQVSVDLMIGLPQQTPAELRAEVAQFLAMQPDHLSIYQLTIEPHTAFSAAARRGTLSPLPDDDQAELYQLVQAEMTQGGFVQYEISSYARWRNSLQSLGTAVDTRAVHNRLYWTGGEYLGLGVSAHSFRRLSDGGAERFANARSPAVYLQQGRRHKQLPLVSTRSESAFYEQLSATQVAREAMWLGLRQLEGISCSRFLEQHRVDPRLAYAQEIEALCHSGWLAQEGDVLKLTPAGVLFADAVGATFLSP